MTCYAREFVASPTCVARPNTHTHGLALHAHREVLMPRGCISPSLSPFTHLDYPYLFLLVGTPFKRTSHHREQCRRLRMLLLGTPARVIGPAVRFGASAHVRGASGALPPNHSETLTAFFQLRQAPSIGRRAYHHSYCRRRDGGSG